MRRIGVTVAASAESSMRVPKRTTRNIGRLIELTIRTRDADPTARNRVTRGERERDGGVEDSLQESGRVSANELVKNAVDIDKRPGDEDGSEGQGDVGVGGPHVFGADRG